jgi:hypothetical protein
MQPEQLQEILDLWEIEGKFRHGVHSHVDLNCVDFVQDLIEEIHVANGAQEFPPKEVQVKKGDFEMKLKEFRQLSIKFTISYWMRLIFQFIPFSLNFVVF